MFNLFKNKNEIEMYAYVKGTTKNIEDVDDEMFAQELIGKGIAIIPNEGTIVAPSDGKILMVFPTKHALGLQLDNGIEVLIHIGVDTVKMKGEGFTAYVEEGQFVKRGEKLVEVNFDLVKERGYQIDVLLVVTSAKDTYSMKYPVFDKKVDHRDMILNVSKL